MAKIKPALRPGDVLLFKPSAWGILLPLVKCLVTYGHVALYYTETKRELPLIIESIGRGVLIRSLYAYAGKKVRLMRPKVDDATALRVGKEAERLADTPSSWFGYFDIPRFVVPKLILANFASWLPQKWVVVIKMLAYSYKANNVYICSEFVCQAYLNAGVALVDKGTIPLPDDIAGSDKLESLGDIAIPEKA